MRPHVTHKASPTSSSSSTGTRGNTATTDSIKSGGSQNGGGLVGECAAEEEGVCGAAVRVELADSEWRVCERRLAPLLAERNATALRQQLAQLHEVPEHWLCRVAVAAAAAAAGNTQQEEEQQQQEDADPQRQQKLDVESQQQLLLLADIIRRPISLSHVTRELRSHHSLSECVCLASVVLQLAASSDDLTDSSFSTPPPPPSQQGEGRLSLTEAVFQWTTVVLDAHYLSLVMSVDEAVVSLLQQLADWQDAQEASVDESLRTISALDRLSVKQKGAPAAVKSGYCLETVVL